MITIDQWLVDATEKLAKANIPSARLDAELILTTTTDKSREYLLAHSKETVPLGFFKKSNQWLQRRVKREPLAYILGYKEFYGRNFIVTSDTLIPRPESESLVDLIKELDSKTVVDIGTGSGCLAITAKLELPDTQVIATDIDTAALKIAKANAKKHKVEIEFIKNNLLDFPLSIVEHLTSNVHYPLSIVSNLPYVPKDMITSPEIKQEPSIALFSGKDGLDHYRRFWQQIAQLKTRPQYILTESLQKQHKTTRDLALASGYKLQKTDLLVQLFEN